jgi:hypothetical protein
VSPPLLFGRNWQPVFTRLLLQRSNNLSVAMNNIAQGITPAE